MAGQSWVAETRTLRIVSCDVHTKLRHQFWRGGTRPLNYVSTRKAATCESRHVVQRPETHWDKPSGEERFQKLTEFVEPSGDHSH